MRSEMAQPCSGCSATVFRISRSSVPCGSSIRLLSIFPLSLLQKVLPLLLLQQYTRIHETHSGRLFYGLRPLGTGAQTRHAPAAHRVTTARRRKTFSGMGGL